MSTANLDIYRNPVAQLPHVYARERTSQLTTCDKRVVGLGARATDIIIYAIGVPDGVWPRANIARTTSNATRRLYIFSQFELDDRLLLLVDSYYTGKKYPFGVDELRPLQITPVLPIAPPVTSATSNFYTLSEDIKHDQAFIRARCLLAGCTEYRKFRLRHTPANVCYDTATGLAYRCAMPLEPGRRLVLIVPANFVRTSRRAGYLYFADNRLILTDDVVILASSRMMNRSCDSMAPCTWLAMRIELVRRFCGSKEREEARELARIIIHIISTNE
ncbi:unnamed protein product [Trichogramma brassicae]|uniref:Uncharacterized protein n=1 Tax=Trichogramma brassicae TaxID=86971 RepID=A0A6H5I9U0_9HYME|nr:unnamed protein product [Trichogramma brassicae]